MSDPMAGRADAAHEVVLRYSNGRWVASGASLELAHEDLSALDALILDALAPRPGARVHVRFDPSSLPTWTRQYHAHYLNYVLRAPRAAGLER